MINNIAHIGLTVSNLQRSIEFYRDILGLKYIGKMVMTGEATEKLFNLKNCVAKVAYLKCGEDLSSPPVELIQFVSEKADKKFNKLNSISISELCFYVDDIDSMYNELKEKGVEFISEPQSFNFEADGFGKSKAVYFKDPDGIILELMECIE